jgi:hypothetical protein
MDYVTEIEEISFRSLHGKGSRPATWSTVYPWY